MIGGYLLKWLGLLAIILGLIAFLAAFSVPESSTALLVIGLVLMFGGGFCRYVSRQTMRTTK